MRERHYSVEELAEMWGFSRTTIRKLFRHDPNVLKLPGDGLTLGTAGREYVTLSIPESAALRKYQTLKQEPVKVRLPAKKPVTVARLHDPKARRKGPRAA